MRLNEKDPSIGSFINLSLETAYGLLGNTELGMVVAALATVFLKTKPYPSEGAPRRAREYRVGKEDAILATASPRSRAVVLRRRASRGVRRRV